MVVITVKYDGETYVSKPIKADNPENDNLDYWTEWFKDIGGYLNLPLNNGGKLLLKSEAIKRAVFLFEEV